MKTLLLALLLASSVSVAQEAPQPVQPEQQQPTEPVAPPVEQQPVPEGQWVYTSEYGWVYMPWNEQYVNSPPGTEYPQQYVYYNGMWVWLASPWVWGWGPYPYYGGYGYDHFVWYGRPYYGHWYGHVGPYRIYRGPVRYYRGAPPVRYAPHAVPHYHSAPPGRGANPGHGGGQRHR